MELNMKACNEKKPISSDAIMPSSFIDCILWFCTYYQNPLNKSWLLNGLPCVKDDVAPNALARLAERAELDLQQRSCAMKHLKRMNFPVLLPMSGGGFATAEFMPDGVKLHQAQSASLITYDEFTKLYTGEIYLVTPKTQPDSRVPTQGASHIKLWFLRGFTQVLPSYGEVLLASFLINLFALASPLFIMNVYDRVVPNQALETLWVLAMGMLIIYLFDFTMRTLRVYFIDHAGQRVDSKLSAEIFERVIGIPQSSQKQSASAMSNTVMAFEHFREFITSATISLLVDLPFVVLFLFIIWLLGGSLFWISLVAIPLVVSICLVIQKFLSHLVEEQYRYNAQKQIFLLESLAGTETIKTQQAQSHFQQRWEGLVHQAAKQGMKLRKLSQMGLHCATWITQMSTVIVIIMGVYAIAAGELTMGALIACTILTGRALAPMAQVANLISRYCQTRLALDNLQELMQTPTEQMQKSKPVHLSELKGDFQLKQVCFQYNEEELPVLINVNCQIKTGERVAILGRIGSGKSTLQKMLLSLYQPTKGAICLDEIDLRHLDPNDVRAGIGYVPQDVKCFFGTLRDNILMGHEQVDDEKLLKAVEIAGLKEFVNQHPKGLDWPIAEEGRNLSGGQRQAIGIARAFLTDPNIFVFDEPSYAMDDVSEARFVKAMAQELKGKTLILTTHRSRLLSLVDRLIILNHGKILLDGPKQEVLQRMQNIANTQNNGAKDG